MYKISTDKEYFIEPMKNIKIIFYNSNSVTVTGDLILVFGNGFNCIQTKTVLSKLIKVMYE